VLAEQRGRTTQRGDRFRVLDLAAADHLERVSERFSAHGEDLVVVELLRRFGKIARQEEVNALVAESGSGENAAERRPLSRDESRLFAQLPLRAPLRRFAGCQRAGGNLPDVSARRVPPLPDERHVVVRVDGNDRSGARMMDDLERDRSAVRERHLLDPQIDDAALIHLTFGHAAALPRPRCTPPSRSRRSSVQQRWQEPAR
jgi:hypothetical protein